MNDEVLFKLVARVDNNRSEIRYVPHPINAEQRWTGGGHMRFFVMSDKEYYYIANTGDSPDELALFTKDELEQFDDELFEMFEPIRV